MKRRVVLTAAIGILLIWMLPQLVQWIQVMYLTIQHGAELTNAALQFEITTNTLSGSRERYYDEERLKFDFVAAGPALRGRLGYWDSVWKDDPANHPDLYLVTDQRLSDVRVVEYDNVRATMTARIQWHYRLVNRETMLTEQESDAAAERTYWFIFEEDTWKVSDFESAGPIKR
jgi:hypothetical protein